MSDAPMGPGWWKASDGRWYPPESRPAGSEPTTPHAAWSMPPGTGPAAGRSPGASPYDTPPPADGKGFLRSLYDFRFDHFVTPKVLRFIYALNVILLTLVAVIGLLASFAYASDEPAALPIALIGIPISYVLMLTFIRMYLELVAALFRIADDLRWMRRAKESGR